MLTLLLSLSLAHAAPKAPPAPPTPCKAETEALAAAGPAAAGKSFADLATCDAALAKGAADKAFGTILAGPGGDAAMLAGIKVGAGERVRAWVETLDANDRSTAIDTLGKSCAAEGVPAFWTQAHAALGDAFWANGWFKGLDECRDASVRPLLTAAAEAPVKDRTRYLSVIEATSRNLGAEALPLLESLLGKHGADPELSTYIVRAFGDAAGVGDVAGINAGASVKAIEAIRKAAPTLSEKGVDQARVTLGALKAAEQVGDELAAVRYKGMAQPGGKLLYGVFVSEVATCKKGDVKVEVHHAPATLTAWPDQVKDRVTPGITPPVGVWKLGLGEKCKGTSVVSVTTSAVPLKDAAAYAQWQGEQLRELQKAQPGVKVKEIAETALDL